MIRGMMLGVLLAILGCSSEDHSWQAPAQAWQDMMIRVETRPTVLRQGMNEFLVIADRQQRGFTSDLMVDVRTEHSDWKQAMPDGALGVYRRALPVRDVQHDHLYVRLQRKGEHGELIFSLAPGGKPH